MAIARFALLSQNGLPLDGLREHLATVVIARDGNGWIVHDELSGAGREGDPRVGRHHTWRDCA
jgi:hypothetical protein